MKRLLDNKTSLFFMLTNMGSKGLAAVAQLYAIFVFTKMHSQDDAAVIFLLLGYAIWFQVFEFGLSQTLQNRFNAKQISSVNMAKAILTQYAAMLLVACLVVGTPLLADVLLGNATRAVSVQATKAFTIGAAILLVASNNAIIQRVLLVLNQGRRANLLIFAQSFLAIAAMGCYDLIGVPNLDLAVFLYLSPQVLVYLPVLAGLMMKVARKQSPSLKKDTPHFFTDSLGFWVLTILSAIYLGLDYYFAAHHLSSEEIVSYHLATRIFFISYAAYIAFVQHCARRLCYQTIDSQAHKVLAVLKSSVLVGFGAVLVIYTLAVAMELCGLLRYMTNGVGVSFTILFAAFVYYVVRVFRDVGLVVASGLNAKRLLYAVYVIELLGGASLMTLIVPIYGALGIFFSMSVASAMGLFLLMLYAKNAGYQY